MDGPKLRDALHLLLPAAQVREISMSLGVVERIRKLDLHALVAALVMTAGSDDSGRQSDVYTRYLDEGGQRVVRSAFYSWFTPKLALLMTGLAQEAMATIRALPPLLTGDLAGVVDWILVDSETVALPVELVEDFPSTSASAGLKVHKWFSLGRNNIVDIQITPARDHDAPRLVVDESWRGKGLIVDLGYASKSLIAACHRHDVALVLRLKKGWRPRLLREVCADGTVFEVDGEEVTEHLLGLRTEETGGATFDLDVAFGQGRDRVEARLVGVVGPGGGYHWCLTTLPRSTHPPAKVCRLYRTRWEIECDMKRDKAGARLDQIGGKKVESVIALVYASLLRTMLANMLVYIDLRDRPPTRPPLHGLAVALALNVNHGLILAALDLDLPELWDRAAMVIRARGHDPNWRRRPSVLDQLRGLTAPPGRPKRARLKDCPPEARPYRQEGCATM